MTKQFIMPEPTTQSVGVASVPIRDLPEGLPGWLSMKPAAAAVLTLAQRDDGHIDITARTMSDARPSEFPLPWLVEQALVPRVTTLISHEDRRVLAVDACDRRYFVEPSIAKLLAGGDRVIDVGELAAGEPVAARELARRMRVPVMDANGESNERLWNSKTTPALEERALAAAVLQLICWASLAAFSAAEPGLFYEPMLALRHWLFDQQKAYPGLASWANSKPIMRAVSFEQEYRRDLAQRLRGEPSEWPRFAEGLFHA